MSGKKQIKSPVQATKVKKKRPVRMVYDITQFKKMTGKNLICAWQGLVINRKSMLDDIRRLKERICAGQLHVLHMYGNLVNGVTYIFRGVEHLLVLNSISYSEIKNLDLDVEIVVQQYNKLTKDEIQRASAEA
jgi:hypothetical protein